LQGSAISASSIGDDISSADFTKSLRAQKVGNVKPAKLSYISDNSVDIIAQKKVGGQEVGNIF